jgi:hypothetical protein
MIVFGSFLAGAIISLLIPVGVFLAILAWYVHSMGRVARVPAGESARESPTPPPSA